MNSGQRVVTVNQAAARLGGTAGHTDHEHRSSGINLYNNL